MEPSSPSVQYQHFQLSKLPRNDVEKNATRNRRRENCGKVEASVELGLPCCGKLSNMAARKLAAVDTNQDHSFQDTSRKSTRTCDNNISASQKAKWRTSWEYIHMDNVPNKPQRLFGESKFHQNPATKNSETIVRCNK